MIHSQRLIKHLATFDQGRGLVGHMLLLWPFFLLLIPPHGLFGGTEVWYLGYAKKIADPAWHGPFSLYYAASGVENLLFHTVIGSILEHVTLTQLQIWGRIALTFCMALAVAGFFRQVGISRLGGLIVLMIYALFDQYLMGSARAFDEIDPRNIASVFVLVTVTQLLKNRLKTVYLLLSFLTLIHLFYGFFWSLFVSCYLLVKKRFKTVVYGNLLFLAISLPVVFMVYQEYREIAFSASGPEAQRILDHFVQANAYEMGLFRSLSDFNRWLPGIFRMMMVSFTLYALLSYRQQFKERHPQIHELALLVAVITGLNWLFIVLNLFDPEAYVFGKLSPFRHTAHLFLLWLTLMVLTLSLFIHQTRQSGFHVALFLSLLVFFLPYQARRSLLLPLHGHHKTQAVLAHIHQHTPPEALFLVSEASRLGYTFELYADRPSYVTTLMPRRPKQILDWMERRERTAAFMTQGCDYAIGIPVDYLLLAADEPYAPFAACSTRVYQGARYTLLAVNRSWAGRRPSQSAGE